MQRYSNLSGDSGIRAYETSNHCIDVEFQNGSVYRYTYSSPGSEEVEEMKRLAASGKGLTTFINKYVRENYEAKLR